MPYDPDRHHRRSIRMPGWDYTQAGAYFVTIVTHGRECIFGEIVGDIMHLSAWGEIAARCWQNIPHHFPHVGLDEWVVMPNHIHGIIIITNTDNVVGAQHAAPLPGQHDPSPDTSPPAPLPGQPGPRRTNIQPGSLGAIIRSFKSAVTKRINAQRDTPGAPVWQRNYWEHVIRTERALDAIRRYITHNPARWHLDRYNPNAIGPDPWAQRAWRLMRSTSAESEVRS